jgi:hypothetical protein
MCRDESSVQSADMKFLHAVNGRIRLYHTIKGERKREKLEVKPLLRKIIHCRQMGRASSKNVKTSPLKNSLEITTNRKKQPGKNKN